MTRFLLIRHATTDSVGKKLSGRMTGVHLNEQGRLQAKRLVERLQGLPVVAVYSSPLERAVETAEPVCNQLNIEPRITDDFIEIDFGNWTNSNFETLKSQSTFQQFNSFRSSTRIPGGELMVEAQVRMITGMERLLMVHNNETVAVVSHADMIKAAISYYAGIHLDMFQRIEISPASVSIIEIYDDTARIMLVNDTGEIKI